MLTMPKELLQSFGSKQVKINSTLILLLEILVLHAQIKLIDWYWLLVIKSLSIAGSDTPILYMESSIYSTRLVHPQLTEKTF